MPVRPLVEADLPEVVDLYWTYLRHRKGAIPQALLKLFHELFFVNPFSDNEFPSLVYEAPDGKVKGFLGRNVRRMSYCGQTIRVVFGGNLVVHPESRSGIAAARLVSTSLSGNHDLALTDSANNISKDILQRMGCSVVPALNIHWRRPLRPSQYAIYGLSAATKSLVLAILRIAAQPFCMIADSVASRFSPNLFRATMPRLVGEELDTETLLQCMVEFRKPYSLWPEYTLSSLQWLLGFMASRPARGFLRKVLLREAKKIVGWYIYYVKPGAISQVVQIGGDPRLTKDILDHLFWDGLEHAVIGLHGVLDIRHAADFSDKGCFFTCRGGWTVGTSRNPQIMRSLERGDAFFSRLDGEWCLDPGD